MILLHRNIRSILSAQDTKEEGLKTMSGVWNTKYGRRRVRQDPPTIDEAILAARDLSDDLQVQVEIAAALIDMPRERGHGCGGAIDATQGRQPHGRLHRPRRQPSRCRGRTQGAAPAGSNRPSGAAVKSGRRLRAVATASAAVRDRGWRG